MNQKEGTQLSANHSLQISEQKHPGFVLFVEENMGEQLSDVGAIYERLRRISDPMFIEAAKELLDQADKFEEFVDVLSRNMNHGGGELAPQANAAVKRWREVALRLIGAYMDKVLGQSK